MLSPIIACCFISLINAATKFEGADRQTSRFITLNLDSRMTCFYEPLDAGMNIKLNLRAHRSEVQPLQLRFSSPSNTLSDWQSGNGIVASFYNITETGDHEICITTQHETKISLHIYFYDPIAIELALDKWLKEHELGKSVQTSVANMVSHLYRIKYSIKFYNQITFRDEEMQQSNSDRIMNFSVIFIVFTLLIGVIQV